MKYQYRVLKVCFLLLLIAPSILWFFLKPTDYDPNRDMIENRMLAVAPSFDIHTIRQYPALFDSYFNDHLPFRSDMIELFASLEYKLFGETINSNVIIGQDDWLFYSNPADGCSINSYKGIDHFNQEEMKLIADNLTTACDRIEEMGAEFIVMIPPNKENVYQEYIPEEILRVSELNRMDLLVEYLRENTDLRVVYPKDALIQQKGKLPLYYRQDTHWNHLGAYIGSSELLKEMGMMLPEIDELRINETNAAYCDLRNMGRLYGIMKPEMDYYVEGFSSYSASIAESVAGSIIRYKSDNANGKKLLIQRDSFSTAMLEYLPSCFEESVFVQWGAFDPQIIEDEKPDIFVLELVERSTPLLFSYRL